MRSRKYEVMGIDGKLFKRLQQQANRENITVDVLVHRYLSYGLTNWADVIADFLQTNKIKNNLEENYII